MNHRMQINVANKIPYENVTMCCNDYYILPNKIPYVIKYGKYAIVYGILLYKYGTWHYTCVCKLPYIIYHGT